MCDPVGSHTLFIISIEVPGPGPINLQHITTIHLYIKRGPTTLGCIACFRQIGVV